LHMIHNVVTTIKWTDRLCFLLLSFFNTHTSKERHESEVERVTAAIERRRQERVVITFDIRAALLEECRKIAQERRYTRLSRIHVSDLLEYHQRVRTALEDDQTSIAYHIRQWLGFRNKNEMMLRVLNRAVDLVQTENEEDNDFHYMDFNVRYQRSM